MITASADSGIKLFTYPFNIVAGPLSLIPRNSASPIIDRITRIRENLSECAFLGPFPDQINRARFRLVKYKPNGIPSSFPVYWKVVKSYQDVGNICEGKSAISPYIQSVSGSAKLEELSGTELAAYFEGYRVSLFKIGLLAKLILESFCLLYVPPAGSIWFPARIGGGGKRTTRIFLIVVKARRNVWGMCTIRMCLIPARGALGHNTIFLCMSAKSSHKLFHGVKPVSENCKRDHALILASLGLMARNMLRSIIYSKQANQ